MHLSPARRAEMLFAKSLPGTKNETSIPSAPVAEAHSEKDEPRVGPRRLFVKRRCRYGFGTSAGASFDGVLLPPESTAST